VELSRRRTASAPSLNENSILVELGDTGRHRAIRYVDISGGIPGDIGGAVEVVPGKTSPTAGFGIRRTHGIVDRLWFAPHRHDNAAFLIELDDHIRTFVHDPDVILRVDAHSMCLDKAIQALTDFSDVLAVLIEFEQTRCGTHKNAVCSGGYIYRSGPRVNEDVTLGVRGDAQNLAEVDVIRHLQKIGRRVVRDFGNRALREDRYATEKGSEHSNKLHSTGYDFICHVSTQREEVWIKLSFVCGCRSSFCTRQPVISAVKISFSLRQSMAWTVVNSFNCLPALPNRPRTLPSSSIL